MELQIWGIFAEVNHQSLEKGFYHYHPVAIVVCHAIPILKLKGPERCAPAQRVLVKLSYEEGFESCEGHFSITPENMQ